MCKKVRELINSGKSDAELIAILVKDGFSLEQAKKIVEAKKNTKIVIVKK